MADDSWMKAYQPPADTSQKMYRPEPDQSQKALIHPSFPAMGPEKRAHEGSQSTTPEKGNP